MPTSLDSLDERILGILEEDASIANNELARRVHASAATCLRRVQRLTAAGVIAKQVAILNPGSFGPSLTAVVEITLDRQGAEHQSAFEHKVGSEPAILQCYRVSPGPDFVLIAQVKDMPAYHALAHRLFTSDANVRNVRAFFSIHCSKFDTRIAR